MQGKKYTTEEREAIKEGALDYFRAEVGRSKESFYKHAKIGHSFFYGLMAEDPDFKKALASAISENQHRTTDGAMGLLYKHMFKDGSEAAVRFYLSRAKTSPLRNEHHQIDVANVKDVTPLTAIPTNEEQIDAELDAITATFEMLKRSQDEKNQGSE